MADRLPDSRPMPSSFEEDDRYNERAVDKFFRKVKEEPLIPVGMGLTLFALVNSFRAIRRGDSATAQRMFRARIMAQGFTVLAMVAGGAYYKQDRNRSAELNKVKSQAEAEDKRLKWIRELEMRDEEEKSLRRRIEARKQRAEAKRKELEGEAPAEPEKAKTSGSTVLNALGLKSSAETKQSQAAESKDEAAGHGDRQPARKRKENPNSSLDGLGNLISQQKKSAVAEESEEQDGKASKP